MIFGSETCHGFQKRNYRCNLSRFLQTICPSFCSTKICSWRPCCSTVHTCNVLGQCDCTGYCIV